MPKIITRILTILAIAATTLTSPAYGQAWSSGAGVTPNWSSTIQWVPPFVVDSPHPADADEPPVAATDGVIYNRQDWMLNVGGRSQIGLTADGTDPNVGGSVEGGKFRIQCAPSFSKRADPILAPGQHPALHGHTVLGWMDRAGFEDATYASVAANPKSTCDGGPLNRSVYWEPSIYRLIGGVIFTVKPDRTVNYYVLPAPEGQRSTRIRRGFAVIGGANPGNFNDTARRAEYAAAGFEYPGTPTTPAGWGGWICRDAAASTARGVLPAHAMTDRTGAVPNPIAARYLKGPNGEDPWNGQCTAGTLFMRVDMPGCWDATNLTSPDGRGHVRYKARKSDDTFANSCPLNYAKILHFQGTTQFTHNGWAADLQHWYFASDRMNPPGAAAEPANHDPCRKVGPYFCNGATGHFDIMFNFDQTVFDKLHRDCIGMIINGVDGTHADCGTGGFSDAPWGALKFNGPSPDQQWSPPTISSTPPDQRASPSARGNRYFPVDPDDQVQGGTLFDLHNGHGGG